MKEITRIITIELTEIARINDEDEIYTRDEVMREAPTHIKKALGVDDINIVKVQDFIREVEVKENDRE